MPNIENDRRCLRWWLVMLVLIISSQVQADGVYEKQSSASFDVLYKAVYASLEENRFYVVHELDIGQSMARFGKNWGDNYNRNGLTAYRSMIVCNGWYANEVSNMDPKMLALCPLRINMIQREGMTSVLFEKPTVAAEGSAALPVLQEVEETIVKAIETGVRSVR